MPVHGLVYDGSCVSEVQEGVPIVQSDSPLLVHPRYSYFFLAMWYVCKIEHVVRNFTRCWIDNNNRDGVSIQQLCEEFSNQDDVIDGMHRVFVHGRRHLLDSVGSHLQSLRDCALPWE